MLVCNATVFNGVCPSSCAESHSVRQIAPAACCMTLVAAPSIHSCPGHVHRGRNLGSLHAQGLNCVRVVWVAGLGQAHQPRVQSQSLSPLRHPRCLICCLLLCRPQQWLLPASSLPGKTDKTRCHAMLLVAFHASQLKLLISRCRGCRAPSLISGCTPCWSSQSYAPLVSLWGRSAAPAVSFWQPRGLCSPSCRASGSFRWPMSCTEVGVKVGSVWSIGVVHPRPWPAS